jgi:phospholipid/cholesterol/gamma-HCH transport system ATP-binding protein
MKDILKIEGIHSQFETREIHKGISFSLRVGEITALIGGSGSGKSVLLKIILGLVNQTKGKVTLFDQDVSQLEEDGLQKIRNRCGVLFQNGALFSAITVGENVATPLREQTSFSEATIQEIVALRLALAGLEAKDAALMPSELSGGMRKRAALARALALEPELLFLDEPTSGLDPINARAFDKLIETLSSSLGLTVLMVTHDLGSINLVSDRLLVLDEGKLIADGTVQEVKSTKNEWIDEYFSAQGY